METRVVLFVVTLSLMVAVALGQPGKPTDLEVLPALAVDEGVKVTMTCKKGTGTPTSYKFERAGANIPSTGTASIVNEVMTLTVVVATDHDKAFTCKATDGSGDSVASDVKTLQVTAIPAPTLTSDPVASNSKVTVNNGFPAKFTCAKASTANQDPVKYKFLEGTNEITTGTPAGASVTGAVLTVTASSTWEGKVIKCQHYNTDTARTDSTAASPLSVTMVPNKPTIKFDSPLKEGAELKVTCEKAGDVAVTEFEIYQGTDKQSDGITSSTGSLKDILTVAKVKVADHNGKKYKCRAKNSNGFSEYSDEKTLVVEAGAASQLVSMTTMALVLVLGAFFKE